MEPVGCDHRFINLKRGDLRLSINVCDKDADHILEYVLSGLEKN